MCPVTEVENWWNQAREPALYALWLVTTLHTSRELEGFLSASLYCMLNTCRPVRTFAQIDDQGTGTLYIRTSGN